MKCPACGKTDNLEMGKTKAGADLLMEVRRVPHFAVCPATRKNGQKPVKRVKVKPIVAEAAKMLVEGQKLKPDEAKKLVLQVLAAGEPGEDAALLAVAALKRKGEGHGLHAIR